MSDLDSIAVCYQHQSSQQDAQILANRLAVPLLDQLPDNTDYKFLLVFEPPGNKAHNNGYQLALHFPNEKLNPIVIDFLGHQLQYRKKFGGGRQQAIAKAVGLKRGYTPKLLDGTAGMGKDAFILASLNCNVTMCERNPVIQALLQDGLKRLEQASNDEISLQLELENSLHYMENHASDFDVIYLDPMYPHRTKSALVKKEMRILRSLVGDDTDFDSVFEIALRTAKNRVVIKRPKAAASIGQRPPTHCVESKKTRYDIYLANTDL